jgi:diadenosine tetraphosphate (Ap4A) HIT family hydrolase
MYEIEGRIRSYKDTPWCSNPKAYQNIVHEDDNVIVFKDRYPVTEGHLLFVPKKVTRRLDITICFEYAWEWGVKGICNYEYEAFNIGINNGEAAGQSVMWPHVHLIPRRKGDTPNPRGGIRGVIPMNQDYAVPAPCSRTALVRDRAIDEIKFENNKKKNTQSWEKVDEAEWAKVVKRMRDKEKRKEKENK